MENPIEVAKVIETLIADAGDEGTTLLEVVKNAVPQLAEESIKQFFDFIVDGVKSSDWSQKVYSHNKVTALPKFAGGY